LQWYISRNLSLGKPLTGPVGSRAARMQKRLSTGLCGRAEHSMISRDRVIRTLNHQPIDRVPRDLWLLPDMESGRTDEVSEMHARFPSDVLHLETKWP